MGQKTWAWLLWLATLAALVLWLRNVWDAQHIPFYVQAFACGGLSGSTYLPLVWLYRRVVHGAVAAWHFRDSSPEKASE